MKALIFDLDGTLVDSMWIWREIDIEYMNRHGYATTREELDAFQAEIEGMSFRETAEWVSSHYDIPRTVEEMMDDGMFETEDLEEDLLLSKEESDPTFVAQQELEDSDLMLDDETVDVLLLCK